MVDRHGLPGQGGYHGWGPENMAYDDDETLGPGPKRIRSLADILLQRLADHLQDRAHRAGGTLGSEQIRQAIEHFRSQTGEDVSDFYRTAWNQCLSVIDEVRREGGRRMPFERLMVKPISHLLPSAPGPFVSGQGLPRRIIPGYLSALQQMLGPVLVEQYQSRSRELVRIIHTARGTDFDWEDVYGDPTSQVIVNDVLVHISKHFANLLHRRGWLVDIINSNMPLGKDEVERDWTFGEPEFRMLMEALFAPLRRQMATEEGARQLRDRYGEVACELLTDLFKDLDDAKSLRLVHRSAG